MPPLPNQAGEKSSAKEDQKQPVNFEVVASRPAFFNKERIKAGDKLICPSLAMVGDWMEAVDPVVDKKIRKYLQDKKDSLKKEMEKKDKDAGL